MEDFQQDSFFMKEALKEAKKAFEEDEVPVGAVMVLQGKIIARGHNQVEVLQDPTAHAEMLCITSAFAFLGSWRVEGLVLYTTLEPCCMCAGAIFSSRISKVVWGAEDIRLGANGSFVDLFALKHPMHQVEVTKGACHEEAALLMRNFFQKKRVDNHGKKNREITRRTCC